MFQRHKLFDCVCLFFAYLTHFLSQNIQYHIFEYEGDYYIALQIHGGCDIRGGYTEPRIFKIDDDYLDMWSGDFGCDNCQANWYVDGAYIYYDGICDDNHKFNMKNLKATEEGQKEWEEGILIIKENGTAICPCCGKGELH